MDAAEGRYQAHSVVSHALPATHAWCVCWYDHITDVVVKVRSRLDDVELRIRQRRLALFGHVARMSPSVLAHDALQSALGARCGSILILLGSGHVGAHG